MSLKDKLDPDLKNPAYPFDVCLTPHTHIKDKRVCTYWAHPSIFDEVGEILTAAGEDAERAATVLRAEGLHVGIYPWDEMNVIVNEMIKKEKEKK
jgi:hypothetical protein